MIATQNTGQGMLPLLQLLGSDVAGFEDLEAAEGLLGRAGEGFSEILAPQLEELLGALGVPPDELEGLELEGLLTRLQGLLDAEGFAAPGSATGNGLPPTLWTGLAQPPNSMHARGEGATRSLPELRPLSAALLHRFAELRQPAPADTGMPRLNGEDAPHAGRDRLLEVLGQALVGASEEQVRTPGRSELLPIAIPLPGSMESGTATALRSQPRLDLTRLLQPGGERALTDQVRMLAGLQGGRAEIKLHPPQLGVLDIRVNVEGDRASVQFISANPVAREVLEAALPRLREALAEGGLSLEDASVSDEPPPEQDPSLTASAEDTGTPEAADSDAADPTGTQGSTLSILNHRLDLFA